MRCAWCGRSIGERLGGISRGADSHGICSKCLALRVDRKSPWWVGPAWALGVAGAVVIACFAYRALLVFARL